jgi:hypothetical protein
LKKTFTFESIENFEKLYITLLDMVEYTGAVIVTIYYPQRIVEIEPHPFSQIIGTGQIDLEVTGDLVKIIATHKSQMQTVDTLIRAFILSRKLGIMAYFMSVQTARRLSASALA